MSSSFLRPWLYAVLCAFTAAGSLGAAQPSRVAGAIDGTQTTLVKGHLHPSAQPAMDQGPVALDFRLDNLTLMLRPSPEQDAELTALLDAQRDPASAEYRRWLSPAEFADRFGVSEEDIGAAKAWLESQGFTVQGTAPSRNWIAFGGTAGAARQAFGVEIHRYLVNGELRFANAAEPSIPAALAGLVSAIRGLDDFGPSAPAAAAPQGLTPESLAAMYNLAELSLAPKIVVAGQAAVNRAAIDSFRAAFGLAASRLEIARAAGRPEPNTMPSAALEIETGLGWIGLAAPHSGLEYIYSSNLLDAVQNAVAGNLAPVILVTRSLSQDGAPATVAAFEEIARQAGAQGIVLLEPIAAKFSVSVSPVTVAPGGVASVTVTLAAAAPTGGATVTLASSNASAFPVPVNVAIAAGQTSASLKVTAGTVTASTRVTLTATYGTSSATASVTVAPAAPAALASISVPSTVVGGAAAALVVRLTEPAPSSGAVVTLDNAKSAVFPLPATVTVPAGERSLSVTVQTTAVTAAAAVSVSATYSGVTKTAAVSVVPLALTGVIAGGKGPEAVTIGGNSVPVTVTLNGPAPSAGINVYLTSSDAADFPVPASITVKGGATSGSITVTTAGVKAATTVTVGASLGTVSKSATVTLQPASLASVSAGSIAVGGNNVTITVQLNGAAAAGGLAVTITSSNTTVLPNASVTVPAGAKSATATVATTAVTASTPVTLTAVSGTVTKTAAVIVTPPGPVSVYIPSPVTGGTSVKMTVMLSGPAPAGGASVALKCTDSSGAASTIFPVPASVTVAAGAKSVETVVAVKIVAASTPLTVTATYGDASKTANVTVAPATLSSVGATATLVGGNKTAVRVYLTGPAPTGGVTVSLKSDHATEFPLPASLTVPAGAASVSTSVTTKPVAAATTVTVTATYGAAPNTVTKTATVKLTPPSLAGLSAPKSVVGGSTAQITVALDGPAAADTAVALTSGSAAVLTVPATATIKAGATSASATIQTSAVASATSVAIQAAYAGVTKSATISVTPVELAAVSATTPVLGGNNATLTVTLNGPAPAGTGAVITLSNGGSKVFPVPASITVKPGEKSASATVQTTAVTASTSVTITATYGSASKSATVNVTPAPAPALDSISAPASMAGGSTASLTVKLTAAALSGGVAVALSSSDSAALAIAGGSVTVRAGERSATVILTAGTVTEAKTVTITATYGSVTKTATVNVTAPALSGIFSPETVTGGVATTVTVSLTGPAPAGGAKVTLTGSSGSSTAFQLPTSVTVAQGAKSASATVPTAAVTALTTVTVTAAYGGVSKTATVKLVPAALAGISISPLGLGAGGKATITANLTGPAVSGVTVALTSNNAALLPVPAAGIAIAAGSKSGTASVQAAASVSSATAVTVTATYNGVSKTAYVMVTPAATSGSGAK